jgi:hypothetical protein
VDDALFSPLTVLLRRRVPAKRITGILRLLMPRMGETYWRAMERCLCNTFYQKFPTGLTPAEREEKQQLSVAFERRVVSELENCSV